MCTRILFLCYLSVATLCLGQSQVTIKVDLQQRLAPFTPIYSWFGYDESNYTTTEQGQALLHQLHDLSPVPVYIRAHFLLATGDGKPELKWSSTNVYTEDVNGHPVYHWEILDGIFDAYAAAHVRPMVELGFMPEALSSHPEPYHVPWPAKPGVAEGWSFPPKDYQRWRELTHQVAAHMVKRYGIETVSTWYWEVWNEPDISYWHGTQQEYDQLYDYAAAGVREAIPHAHVGGPATTGPGATGKAADFLTAFLEHCENGKSAATGGGVPLDFISFHIKGTTNMVDGHVQMGIQQELDNAANGFAIVRRFPKLEHLPIILSEADPEGCAACVASRYPQNGYRNGSLYPAYTATVMKALLELAARDRVNLIGMLTWAFEFEDHPYFEGFRTLATHGIDKPELNFFRMAGLMSGSQVAVSSNGGEPLQQILTSGVRQQTDIDALASSTNGAAAVLLWNYSDNDVSSPAAKIHIAIHGIDPSARRVLVQQYRIDEKHSNAYTAWRRMGSPQTPTAEQYAKLRAAGQLAAFGSPRWVTPDHGQIEIPMELPQPSVSLLRITWSEK